MYMLMQACLVLDLAGKCSHTTSHSISTHSVARNPEEGVHAEVG